MELKAEVSPTENPDYPMNMYISDKDLTTGNLDNTCWFNMIQQSGTKS